MLLNFPNCVKLLISDLQTPPPPPPPSSFSSSSWAQPASEGQEQLGMTVVGTGVCWSRVCGSQPRTRQRFVQSSFARRFHSYRDIGQRGTEEFQRFFTCKRIFPLSVSRLNNTPCVSGTVCTADLAMFSACRASAGSPAPAGRCKQSRGSCGQKCLHWKNPGAVLPAPTQGRMGGRPWE